MLAAKVESVPVAEEKHHVTFFRQSGWMMIATTIGGALMYAVHPIAKKMDTDYAVFMTMLQAVNLMGIPGVGLQSTFAQEAAGAMTPEHERKLAGAFRGVLVATFFIWLAMVAAAVLYREPIQREMKISNIASLWVTLLVGLTMLWRPIVQGVLQGRQNFLWLGNVMIADGIGRLAGVALIVGVLANKAAGAMTAALLGMIFVVGVGGWFCRDLLRGPVEPLKWREWLKRVGPLTIGLGASQFMLAADMIFVQRYFAEDKTKFYAAAGMIGRALVYFTAPVATVMFPKLARSRATGEKTNALALALGLTALAGAGAALACTIMPTLPLRIVYDKSFLDVSGPLVPWFAWSMVPLTLSVVMINSLMAQGRFGSVPWLLAVAVSYGVTLYYRHDTFIQVIQTIGIFSTLLAAICAWFTFRHSRKESKAMPTEAI
jgi:O-antigen/teichoic acid export membrane protein